MSAATLPQLAIIPAASSAWISADEVMQRMMWSRRTFFRRCAELISRDSNKIGANGRPLREYLEASLPTCDASAQQTQLSIVDRSPATLGPLFASVPAISRERVVLTDPKDEAMAESRLQALQPLLDYRIDPDRYERLILQDGTPVTSFARMVRYVAENNCASEATVYRWLQKFRQGGPNALANRMRADKGESRWFNRYPKARILAAYLFLGDVDRSDLGRDEKQGRGQSVAFVHEQLAYQADTLGIPETDLPSRETVRIFLKKAISPAMRTLAREGTTEYRIRMSPYLKRAYIDVFANELWVGDHGIHDVEVANDVFDAVPLGTPGRLHGATFVDYRSRKAWMTWAWKGNSQSMAATAIRALLDAEEPPNCVYLDNGKDMRKLTEGAVRGCNLEGEDLHERQAWYQEQCEPLLKGGFFAQQNVSVVHCIPRHPQSKHVERFFRTMHMRFDAVHSTYTSGTPFTRSEITEKAMMRHRWLLKAGRVDESRHPLASRFMLGCLKWLEEYNNTPQRGEGMDGRTPNEVFRSERNPDRRPIPKASALSMLLLDVAQRMVHECAVRIHNYRYTPRPEDRMAWAAMHEANEQTILVRFNASDPEFAVAANMDGHFIAWLEAEPLVRFAPNSPETQQQIGTSMEIRRGLEKAAKGSIAAIARQARANGARSAEEMLYDRLQLPADGGEVVTQRKPRIRPDKTAIAPASATDIAASFLEGLK